MSSQNRNKNPNNIKALFCRIYIIFPAIVFSQILFVGLLTRNLRNLRAPSSEKIGNVLPPDPGSAADDRTHKLLDRLTRERKEIDRRKQSDSKSPQQKEVEIGETSESSKSSLSLQTENANEKEDWGAILQREGFGIGEFHSEREVDEERNLLVVSKADQEFLDRLNNLRDELLAAAVSTAETKSVTRKKDNAIAVTTNITRQTHAKPPPDQQIDFLTTILSPPNINTMNTTTMILVPSYQGSFVKRQAIRETWMAKTNHNATILFVVAQSNCKECDLDLDVNSTMSKSNNHSATCDEIDHEFLQLEQEQNQDLLEIPMKEGYNRLPEKMIQAYHWVVNNAPNLKWIAKADDDMFVDVQNLEIYVRKYNPEIPMVIGEIIYHSPVAKEGKWADYDYPNSYYPYWPKGSAGHILSRAAVKYLTENSESLHRYQGEDTNIGIWFDEARKSGRLNDVTYIHAPDLFISSDVFTICKRKNIIMAGHDLKPFEILFCYNRSSRIGTLANSWEDTATNFEERIKEEELEQR